MARPSCFALAAAAFWTASLSGLVWLAHRRHVERELALSPQAVTWSEEGWLDDSAMAGVGWLTPGFPRGRAPRCGPRGRFLRVGAFGDSFTFGDEVADGDEYPAALERELSRPGRPVEVYNFGVPNHGFHQSFLMWEAARAAGCIDAAVFFAHGFSADRDASFGRAWQHARFVLDGPGLRLIVPEGADADERRRLALRLLAPLDRLRHDIRPPAALQMWMPDGWTARNPFYYRRDVESEAREIYARLAVRLAASGMPVALVSYDRWIAELAPSSGTLWSVLIPQSYGAAYLAPGRHQSALGNRRVARQIACALARKELCAVDALELVGRPAPEKVSDGAAIAGLDAGMAGAVVFARHALRDGGFWHGEPETAVSLLAFDRPGGSWLDAPMLVPGRRPPPGARLRARWVRNGRPEEALVGEVVASLPGLAVARIGWDLEPWRRDGLTLYPRRPEVGEMKGLWLEDEPLLRRCGRGPALCPESGAYYTAHLPGAARASGEGRVRLAGRPVARWRRWTETTRVAVRGPAGSWLMTAGLP